MQRPTAPAPTDAVARDPDLRHALRALHAAASNPSAARMAQSLADLADCHTRRHAHGSAEACLEAALPWALAAGTADGQVDILVRLSEAAERVAAHQERQRRGNGRPARQRAREHGLDAAMRAAGLSDPACEARVLLRVGDLLERCGDPDRAAMLETRALRLLRGHSTAPGLDPRRVPGPGRLADG